MELASERLILREFDHADLPALLAYWADPRYAEFGDPEAAAPVHARRLLELFVRWAQEVPRRNYQFAVVERGGSGEMIGNCGIRQQESGGGVAGFGVELAPSVWGRGLATEAARRLLSLAFGDLGLREIHGISVAENTRVARLVGRLGFTRIASRPGPDWMRSRGWTETEWRLAAEDWKAEPAG